MAFDLDNEELEATRKLHGLDKENGSDINVGSIEEAIKIVKSLIENTKESLISNTKLSQNRKLNRTIGYKALEILLSDYTKQKQINEEHQKINGELREKVKELEIDLTTVYIKGVEDGKEKYIQKIKDKLEEIQEEENLYAKINISIILEELLHESEDK